MKLSTVDKQKIKDLENDHFRDITEFKFDGKKFVLNSKVRALFQKMFTARIHAVYTIENTNHNTIDFDWSGEDIILINDEAKVIHLSNSEWASFKFL